MWQGVITVAIKEKEEEENWSSGGCVTSKQLCYVVDLLGPCQQGTPRRWPAVMARPCTRMVTAGNGQLLQQSRERLLWASFSAVTSCWLMTAELSCSIHISSLPHMHKLQWKFPLHGGNQIPSISKQQPPRQASFCNWQFPASCTRIEMCACFPVTHTATSKRE